MYIGLNFDNYDKDWSGKKTVLDIFGVSLNTEVPRGKDRIGTLTKPKAKKTSKDKPSLVKSV